MNHFIYTVDIATVRPLTSEEQNDIVIAIGALLDEYPIEFEDWKTKTSTETRII